MLKDDVPVEKRVELHTFVAKGNKLGNQGFHSTTLIRL